MEPKYSQLETVGKTSRHLAEEVVLVTPVHAVVLVVAHPGRHDAPFVVTLEPVWRLLPYIRLGMNCVTNLAILVRRRMARQRSCGGQGRRHN